MQFLNKLQVVFGMNSGNINCYGTHENAGHVRGFHVRLKVKLSYTMAVSR